MTRPLGKVDEEVCLAGLSGKTVVRVAVLLAACLTPILAVAQNDIWLGGAWLWSNTSKWSTGALPTASSNVFIDNGKAGASPVTINYNGAQCGSLTLKGAGGLTMSNNACNTLMGYGQPNGVSFTNQTTIRGAGSIGSPGSSTVTNQGIINANQTTPLTMSVGAATTNNTGTLEATNGATLVLNGSGTVTNTGGIIHADPSSTVQLESGVSITGGTLTTSGSGTIQANCCFNDGALNGVTINGTFQVNGSNIEYLSGTIADNGSIQLNASGGSSILDINGAVTLKGTGTLNMSNDANYFIMGYGQSSPGASLTNQIT